MHGSPPKLLILAIESESNCMLTELIVSYILRLTVTTINVAYNMVEIKLDHNIFTFVLYFCFVVSKKTKYFLFYNCRTLGVLIIITGSLHAPSCH